MLLSRKFNFISESSEQNLIEFIKSEFKRLGYHDPTSRFLRYGYDYGPKEKWVRDIPGELHIPEVPFNSVTVREYLPGMRLDKHVDHSWFYFPIQVLNLGSNAILELIDRHWSIPRRCLYTFDASVPHAVYGNTEPRYIIVYRMRKQGNF